VDVFADSEADVRKRKPGPRLYCPNDILMLSKQPLIGYIFLQVIYQEA
jgi:hypothetical protein